METLEKLHNNFIRMLIRKCGIGIGEDTESYIIIKPKTTGTIKFYADLTSNEVIHNKKEKSYIYYNYKLSALFTSISDSVCYEGFNIHNYNFTPEHLRRIIDYNYALIKDSLYILPKIRIYNNDDIEFLFEIDKNGIRKYQPTGS